MAVSICIYCSSFLFLSWRSMLSSITKTWPSFPTQRGLSGRNWLSGVWPRDVLSGKFCSSDTTEQIQWTHYRNNKLSHSRFREEVAAFILILIFTGDIIYMYFHHNLTRRGNRSFLGIVGTSAAKITNTSNQVLINTDIQPSYNYMYLRWWTVSSRNDMMVNNGQVETTGGPSSPLFLFFTFFNSHTCLSCRLFHRFCKHYVWITHLWNI